MPISNNSVSEVHRATGRLFLTVLVSGDFDEEVRAKRDAQGPIFGLQILFSDLHQQRSASSPAPIRSPQTSLHQGELRAATLLALHSVNNGTPSVRAAIASRRPSSHFALASELTGSRFESAPRLRPTLWRIVASFDVFWRLVDRLPPHDPRMLAVHSAGGPPNRPLKPLALRLFCVRQAGSCGVSCTPARPNVTFSRRNDRGSSRIFLTMAVGHPPKARPHLMSRGTRSLFSRFPLPPLGPD